MYKERIDGIIAADLFVYVDDGRPIGPTEEVCWYYPSKCGFNVLVDGD